MNTNRIKHVSVVVPCRNEEKFIARCLDSIAGNDYPKDKLMVLVIDGRSTDKTKEIVGKYSEKYSYIKLLDNPDKIQTFATNIGIKAAPGDVIIRMDAHAEYPEDYISKMVLWIENTGADCVGGICITRAGADTAIARAIALALSHPFGVGNAYFRTGHREPKYVDTVPFGCYRKEVFEKVGLFNENLNRTDDLEFNLRLKRAGGKILLVPEIISYYYARHNLAGLVKQNFGNGFWVLYSLRFARFPFSIRHLAPFSFILSLLVCFILSFFYSLFIFPFVFLSGAYIVSDIIVSLSIAVKNGFRYFPLLAAVFPALHISYGLGSLWGVIKLFTAKLRWKA